MGRTNGRASRGNCGGEGDKRIWVNPVMGDKGEYGELRRMGGCLKVVCEWREGGGERMWMRGGT